MEQFEGFGVVGEESGNVGFGFFGHGLAGFGEVGVADDGEVFVFFFGPIDEVFECLEVEVGGVLALGGGGGTRRRVQPGWWGSPRRGVFGGGLRFFCSG